MISIIIPTLNEEAGIRQMLETVLAARGEFEVIVVDGHSQDQTAPIASGYCKTILSAPGRAVQMNRGAEEACGDVFLFLHSDVVFPPSGVVSLKNALADPRVVGGNFDIIFEGCGFVPRVFTLFNRCRQALGIFYGDSGIFVRREVFQAMGGYRPIPLMEDFDLARRLVKQGRTVCLKEPLIVSGRRWEENGLFRTVVRWFALHSLYLLGVPAQRLAPFYPAIRRRRQSRTEAGEPLKRKGL